MKNLTVEDKQPLALSTPRVDIVLESDLHFEQGTGAARPSLDFHTSSLDLMHQMHGTTPVRPRQQGKPPRLSLQSTVSNVSMASPFPVTSFVGDFVSTYVSLGFDMFSLILLIVNPDIFLHCLDSQSQI
jgi:hypothetical protein